MTNIKNLTDKGQSIWLDSISKQMSLLSTEIAGQREDIQNIKFENDDSQ